MLLLYIIYYIIYNSKLFFSCFAHRNMLNDTLWRWDDVAENQIIFPKPRSIK